MSLRKSYIPVTSPFFGGHREDVADVWVKRSVSKPIGFNARDSEFSGPLVVCGPKISYLFERSDDLWGFTGMLGAPALGTSPAENVETPDRSRVGRLERACW
jgi:hypothetical protein